MSQVLVDVRSRLGRARRARLAKRWLSDPEQVYLGLSAAIDELDDATSLGVLSWLAVTHAHDPELAERAARRALELDPASQFAAASLARVLARRAEQEEAIEVLRRARSAHPDVPWYDITLADALIEAKKTDEAAWLLEEAVAKPELERHALKRLARLARDRGDFESALKWQRLLVALAPNYLVYASDYLFLAELLCDAERTDEAIEVLNKGHSIYPRNPGINRALAELGVVPPKLAPKRPPVDEAAEGVSRTPIHTPLITEQSDLAAVVDAATAGIRSSSDVIAISESPAAASQGRVVPLEMIRPSKTARVLCRYVGETGPLHSPTGMQGAILDVGVSRVILGAFAGAAGRVMGKRGWFYRAAGPSTAMIDDVAACLPPLDHHIIFGPASPDALATQVARRVGCGVAIVDANHLTGAWVVGASEGVDREWVERALSDNPAGNEDEQTPVVLINRR